MTNPVVERLRRHGLRPRKDLGQHFLVEPGVLTRLVQLIAPAPGTVVLELGAGVGVLTERLLDAGARVVAVEIDAALADVLRAELGDRDAFTLMHMDLAALDVAAMRRQLGISHLKLAGNLPYQLTSTVLFGLFTLEDHLQDAVFMVQREVAERIAGTHGSRNYGILSVLLQTYYDIEIAARVKAGAFLPPPRVESAILRLVPRSGGPALPWADHARYVRMVRHVFNERRKTLRNTLKKFYGLDSSALVDCERAAAIDLGRRPESLSVVEFVRLLHALPASTDSGVEV
ncbi:MAG TPA: 16S rRNA (adenine(1518)-N(6)/adenine(1519)-N(6))-dimethyltransferase RsmA [Candidatus Krumholzibacteria bacterium]|nr:16S rRNA (adenine(1518)-N(6)/adenine(1519)-N(6))-dimethyltransferase RsmA [Candidatus Krumholzibacteria bacterium]